jgi:hypothetical protein
MVFRPIISISLWNAHMAPQIYPLATIKIVNVRIHVFGTCYELMKQYESQR